MQDALENRCNHNHGFLEHENSEESYEENSDEGTEVANNEPIKIQTIVRPQRTKQVSNRLADFKILFNSSVINEGGLIRFDMLVDIEPINYDKEMKSKA